MISIPNLTLAYLLLEWAIRLIMVVVIPVRRPPEAARSWLLLVLFLPVPAFILYRLIGRAAFPSWRRDRFRRAAPERESAGQALMSSKSAPSLSIGVQTGPPIGAQKGPPFTMAQG